MKNEPLQLGSDNFGEVVTQHLGFVDKTLFIKEFFDNRNIKVSIITRPRRFGKTFNLSMLHHFLAAEVDEVKTANLFAGLKISTIDNGSYMKCQGKHPVIFITFKEIKHSTFEEALNSLKLLIQSLYEEHSYLLESSVLKQHEKNKFKKIMTDDINQALLESSIQLLSKFLYKHTGNKVYILIDEYDTPIQAGYIEKYYKEIIGLMGRMFGYALKSNSYLERAVITGILRITKESLFSDLNNPELYTVLDKPYSTHFGFTEVEVHDLLLNFNLVNTEAAVKQWYNGYIFGGTVVYNPWSIVRYINSQGILKPYWINTSGNDLIKKIVINANLDFKQHFELLLQDKSISEPIDDNMVFGSLDGNSQAAWSLLAMSGYLKIISKTNDSPTDNYYNCAIPNLEVKDMYRKIIKTWLGGGAFNNYDTFLKNLLSGNIQEFTERLQELLLQIVSIHDITHKPESFYHGLCLGFLAGLDQNDYEIRSNKESGLGRYDIAIFPKDISQAAVIMELKSVPVSSNLEKDLSAAAQEALLQIDNKQYDAEAKQKGVADVIKIGISFSGKNCVVASNKN